MASESGDDRIRCDTCVWWKLHEGEGEEGTGPCKRYPPFHRDDRDAGNGMWYEPTALCHEYCGEWKPAGSGLLVALGMKEEKPSQPEAKP